MADADTWDVVAVRLDASREIGVFWDRMAVVIQNWELAGNFCVSGHQHWWEYCGQGEWAKASRYWSSHRRGIIKKKVQLLQGPYLVSLLFGSGMG